MPNDKKSRSKVVPKAQKSRKSKAKPKPKTTKRTKRDLRKSIFNPLSRPDNQYSLRPVIKPAVMPPFSSQYYV